MDPMFNGEWKPSEIEMAKSLIVRHNNNNNNNGYYDDTNKKHYDIVDVLQARFPWKEKHQVTDLYVDLVVGMMQMTQCQEKSGTGDTFDQATAVGSDLVNNNFGMPVEDPNMDNMEMLLGSLTKETGAMKTAEAAAPEWQFAPQPVRHTGRFWTTEEHRLFLRGLRVYGRGDWKNISMYFVKTKTPVQVSSHAQKYFRRRESATRRQRYSINDVGLYDAEPWVQNSSGWETLAYAGGGYNPSGAGGQGSTQRAAMNNLAQVWSPFLYRADQASSSQTAWNGDLQMVVAPPAAPVMTGAGSQTAWTDDQQGAFAHQQWMNNMY
ncbi:uncharacterized protein LOC133927533 [Phragmites australis]|uniref:uncharacterized protein LOC133927533 n=1 Tax=Phragmites australis TaxID=29695 RepID=UPI002D774C10|nr:uncharacterized protein LOC133927533 [Phragmites australis]